MPPRTIERILRDLGSPPADDAWAEFLELYAAQIYQVVYHLEPDRDKASDCFQFICEQLIQNRFRRLRAFKIDGAAKFSTWLRAVVRNLCIDWHRKETGRPRAFKSIAKLSAFDQQVFSLLYERGVTLEEGLQLLLSAYPNASEASLTASRERIEAGLTVQQRWLLNSRTVRSNKSEFMADLDEVAPNVLDPRADPEAQAILKERQRHLMRKMKRLSDQDRLLIRFRFEQELTLEQIAKLLNLGNAQRVDRQLKQILAQLREDEDFR